MNTANIENIYELSPVQQGLLFHSLYESDGAYFVQLSYSFDGLLDIVAFTQAWQRVLERHAPLRTSFYWEGIDKPLQVVNKQVNLTLKQLDWREIAPEEQQNKFQAFLLSDRQQGFDLSTKSLLRLTLIRLGDRSYQFVWSSHHIILDGWSTALVFKDFVLLYQGFCQGKDIVLPSSSCFADYIAWLQQQDLDRAETFWRRLLKGVQAPTPLTNLEVNNLPPQTEKYDDGRLKLSVATTDRIKTWAKQHQLTLNTLVQGAWALLLSRYSGQNDVVYGVTVSGRPVDLPSAESMVGMFINTLPLRVRVDGKMPLLPWLGKLQQQLLEIRQYEYSPLVEIQGWSEIPRGVPLFESILVFENYPVDRALQNWQTDLKIHNLSAVDNTNYPLTISAIPGVELELRIAGDRLRFDSSTITRILGHLQTLLEAMVFDSEVRLHELPLLTAAEKQLLVEWNKTTTNYPPQCVHQLFTQQVEKTPNAVAVVFENQSLTYQQLDRQANQLAHYLQKLGVGADVLVGICLDRSLDMAIAVLGVFKAGGAYVPLDPDRPLSQLTYMLQESGCQILLTHKPLAADLDLGKIVYLDADLGVIAQESKSPPNITVAPENLAYLIYTSGSTGLAKGVMVTHSSLTNAYFGWEAAYQLPTISCHLQMANFCFDVFVGDLVRALCSGGKLVLCPRDYLLEPATLYALLCQHQVDCAEFVPAVLTNLIQYLTKTQQRLDFMRLVICGSDSWYGAEYQKIQAVLGDRNRLINSFGLTETTIDSCYFETATGKLSIEQLVPIGRPFVNTQLYILDAYLQPLPIGVCGELYIGGASLARGYHHRPELTAERFIPDCFSTSPGSRMYKTGDLARYLPDGNIAFVGRSDYQVKIRGFRIELGEIEAILSQHPAVEKVVVVAREDELGKRLIAYVQCQDVDLQLRDFLQSKLPQYAIPSAFVLLSALPLLANGKVDRRSLPQIDLAANQSTFTPPRTPVEEVLAGIWAKILRVEKVGIHNNFFELGGHSLLATQVVSRIRETFKLPLPLRALFESPTVATLAPSLITYEVKPGMTEKIAQILQQIEGMSAEDAKIALQSRKAAKSVN